MASAGGKAPVGMLVLGAAMALFGLVLVVVALVKPSRALFRCARDGGVPTCGVELLATVRSERKTVTRPTDVVVRTVGDRPRQLIHLDVTDGADLVSTPRLKSSVPNQQRLNDAAARIRTFIGGGAPVEVDLPLYPVIVAWIGGLVLLGAGGFLAFRYFA